MSDSAGSQPIGPIALYTADWCPACRPAKQFLEEHGVEYTAIDIDQDRSAAEELEAATGKMGIPFLKIGETWVQAYTPGGGPFPREKVAEALGIPRV